MPNEAVACAGDCRRYPAPYFPMTSRDYPQYLAPYPRRDCPDTQPMAASGTSIPSPGCIRYLDTLPLPLHTLSSLPLIPIPGTALDTLPYTALDTCPKLLPILKTLPRLPPIPGMGPAIHDLVSCMMFWFLFSTILKVSDLKSAQIFYW